MRDGLPSCRSARQSVELVIWRTALRSWTDSFGKAAFNTDSTSSRRRRRREEERLTIDARVQCRQRSRRHSPPSRGRGVQAHTRFYDAAIGTRWARGELGRRAAPSAAARSRMVRGPQSTRRLFDRIGNGRSGSTRTTVGGASAARSSEPHVYFANVEANHSNYHPEHQRCRRRNAQRRFSDLLALSRSPDLQRTTRPSPTTLDGSSVIRSQATSFRPT